MMDGYTDIFNARGHLYNEAGSSCPGARENERAALLDLLGDVTGRRLLDIPAGGGYVADGVLSRWPQSGEIICNEPAERFAKAIRPGFTIRHDPLAALGFPDGCLDIVASLAGLHHIADRGPVFREWHRVLRPGGKIAVADVMEGSPSARFLNGFVDANTPGGHDGLFFSAGEFSRGLLDAGFTGVDENHVEVPWIFPDVPTMGNFCRTLFATTKATAEEVIEGIRGYLGWEETGAGIAMNWSLLYAAGTKADQ